MRFPLYNLYASVSIISEKVNFCCCKSNAGNKTFIVLLDTGFGLYFTFGGFKKYTDRDRRLPENSGNRKLTVANRIYVCVHWVIHTSYRRYNILMTSWFWLLKKLSSLDFRLIVRLWVSIVSLCLLLCW